MFAAKFPKSWTDVAAEEGEIGLLLKIMEGFEDYRPGGYTCNLCNKRVEPTTLKCVDFVAAKRAAAKRADAERAAAERARDARKRPHRHPNTTQTRTLIGPSGIGP